jgi:hypothetical protein
MGPWGQRDGETLELDERDVDRLCGLELERCVEAKFVEADEGLGGILRVGRNGYAFNLSGRPDAQSPAFDLDSFDERDVEAVELDAGVKAAFEGGDDSRSEEGFSTAQGDGDGDCEGQQQEQQAGGGPLEPAVTNPERCARFGQKTS